MSLDLVTTVESIERKPDGTHEVQIGIDEGAMLPVSVQKLRARGRALVATGMVEAATSRGRDIVRAIENLSIDEIQLNTEVLEVSTSNRRRVITVKVN